MKFHVTTDGLVEVQFLPTGNWDESLSTLKVLLFQKGVQLLPASDLV